MKNQAPAVLFSPDVFDIAAKFREKMTWSASTRRSGYRFTIIIN
jgi:hypothetical protein